MALITATGLLSGPEQCARELVASSTTFQTEVGAGSEAIALGSVVAGIEFNPTRPYAIVGYPMEDIMGQRDINNTSGTLRVGFEFDMNASYVPLYTDNDATKSEKYQNGVRHFANVIGAIRSEMILNSRDGGRLLVQSMALMSPGISKNTPREEIDDAGSEEHYFWAYFLVQYGIQLL